MIGGFYGYRTVIRDYQKHLRTGKIVSGTLAIRPVGDPDNQSGTTYPWANLYIWPRTEMSGFEGLKGYSDSDAMITLYRLGEAQEPRADDQIIVAGRTYQIRHVTSRLNADEANNFAVYDCTVTS